MLQLCTHLPIFNLLSCHLPTFWVIYHIAVCIDDPATLGTLHGRWAGRLPYLLWTAKGDSDTCCENSVRLPCRWWTVWETSTQAVDRVGDFHTSHLQLGRLPHLVWLSWVTSTPTMDSVGDFIVHCHFTITWPSPNWCFTITFVDNSILLCCYFTVTLLLHHLLPHCFLISWAIVKKLCTCYSQCHV